MSYLDLTSALEDAVLAVDATFPTAYENQPFEPQPGEAYQRIDFLPAEPDDPAYGGGLLRENGMLQVTLCYPVAEGSGPALTRAELLRASLPRGATYTKNGTTVQFSRTAIIFPAIIIANRYCLPLRWRYYANVAP
jgi:hypothetical protein